MPRPPQDTRPVVKLAQGPLSTTDTLVVEEPLEIRVAGDVLSTTMRTPGHDRELAAGFLFAEGILSTRDDLGSLSHCGRLGTPEFGNAIDAISAPGVILDIERQSATRRGTLTTSACGVCGRTSIDDVRARCQPVPDGPRLDPAIVHRALQTLSRSQPVFEQTGGLHAAALFDAAGELLCAFEDIGRHNAVDKCVGALLLRGVIPAPRSGSGQGAPALLTVSGRASFEILQKAAMARIPIVASVSASSTLAAELADVTNITLATFVRNGAMTIVAHSERLT
ncbi:MAG: formate dehydrogenase accessory sulfurtransferase FdhD [Deltaproteobacteria bacterium]|nr:formate dehydrogenase accessory sulfurtransferase FdhD [Deltaproteobacteria bacterium]